MFHKSYSLRHSKYNLPTPFSFLPVQYLKPIDKFFHAVIYYYIYYQPNAYRINLFIHTHIAYITESIMRIQSYFVSDLLGISISAIFENQPNPVYSVNGNSKLFIYSSAISIMNVHASTCKQLIRI